MISEREFAGTFSSFWRANTPNLEGVVRALNAGWERVEPPVKMPTTPQRRDIVSETAFKLFVLERLEVLPSASPLPKAFESAVASLMGLSRKRRVDAQALSGVEAEEVKKIAERLHAFAGRRLDTASLLVEPRFRGHGFIGECQGDIADREAIVEVKYVDRAFRSVDLRQCLVYAALSYLAGAEAFVRVIMYNPFLGVSVDVGVDELVMGASGRTFIEFVSDFSYLVTGGELSR